MNWRWATLTAVLAAVVIGYGAYNERRAPPGGPAAPPPAPAYYLYDAVVSETQPDGSLGMRLNAKRIEHSQSDGSIALQDVRVNYFQAPEREWLLTAERGLIPAESRIVQFSGDVELSPVEEPQNWLRTQALAIDAERNIAYGLGAPAALQFGRHAMTVQNFMADLNTGAVRLESVNGSFRSP
ncbi:MAG TPA: LPS export ABC transporter periplasmic protein LptC [Steroidobacter sp.]|jgi:LPS export ABC transporter protein LptC|nr:LPS export ABC transporter periplasmic protein LptC [Steroidobacteraceae bacterium]HLS79948.1 LPS export ABC transporter periplasmic protein LptC [Steroidobacter sp.]